MPSFTFLKNRSEEAQPLEIPWQCIEKVESDSFENTPQRISRRAYLQKFLKKPNVMTATNTGTKQRKELLNESAPPISGKPKTTEITLSSLYKPLPPTPDQDAIVESVIKPSTKLKRIISPIVISDLHKLFSGAPQFLVYPNQKERDACPPQPHVAFPWDPLHRVKSLRDHHTIIHPAWAFVSTSTELSDQEIQKYDSHRKETVWNKADVASGCRELPNMLSMQGLERGTIGYQAALELSVSDYLSAHETTPWDFSYSYRTSFLQRKERFRSLTDAVLVKRLIALGDDYHKHNLQYQKPEFQLYSEIFTKILSPTPSPRLREIGDSQSLQVQVSHLIEVLEAPKVWIDFSHVAWRIRIGQILWGSSTSNSSENSTFLSTEFGTRNYNSQKYWLLLQILLGCEVVLRLDALSNQPVSNTTRPYEKIKILSHERSKSLNWTLLLARTWLDNIRMETQDSEALGSNWMYWDDPQTTSDYYLDKLKFRGRHEDRQISGLLKFAQSLKWPNMERLKVNAANMSRVRSIPNIARESSQEYGKTLSGRGDSQLAATQQSQIQTDNLMSTWLCDSYMSGLVLPGESLSFLLISALLQNDLHALSRLGHRIDPEGGFMYGGRSFWSSSCIVGKVIAAKNDSSCCMGWVSSDVLPRGAQEGWIRLESQLKQTFCTNKKSRKANLWNRKVVERHGSVIAGADTSTILIGDFVLPSEKPLFSPMTVEFLSLDLFPLDESISPPRKPNSSDISSPNESENPKYPTFLSTIRFSIEVVGERPRELSVDLTHNVYFVTVHPCIPPYLAETRQSPVNPSFQEPLSDPPVSKQRAPGHSLHKAFTYTKVSLSHVLSTPVSTQFSTLLFPPTSPVITQSSIHTTSSSIPKVLILDCIEPTIEIDVELAEISSRLEFTNDIELLARSICAERGWNALISRKDRCCLACSIREASALGLRVIIRIS